MRLLPLLISSGIIVMCGCKSKKNDIFFERVPEVVSAPLNRSAQQTPQEIEDSLEQKRLAGRFPNLYPNLSWGDDRAEELLTKIEENIPQLNNIYNYILKSNKALDSVEIQLEILIDGYGKVIQCKVRRSSANDSKFGQMLVSEIKRWQFKKIDQNRATCPYFTFRFPL